MPSDFSLVAMNTVHRVVMQLTGGRLGWRLAGMPVLELTTRGRRSGEPRSVMLTSPVQLGESFVVVASRGGDDHDPAWFQNLKEEPRVLVARRGGPPQRMIARVATSTERERLWPWVTQKYSAYAAYQKRTDREIPLVLLDPLQ